MPLLLEPPFYLLVWMPRALQDEFPVYGIEERLEGSQSVDGQQQVRQPPAAPCIAQRPSLPLSSPLLLRSLRSNSMPS